MHTVKVEKYHISVSTKDSLTEAMRDFDTEAGQRWGDAFRLMTNGGRNTAAYVMPAGMSFSHIDFAPSDTAVLPDGIVQAGTNHDYAARENLARWGYLDTADEAIGNVWREQDGSSYHDCGMYVTNFVVANAFTVVTVHYSEYEYRTESTGYATRWTIQEVLTVPAGGYVVAEYGDYSTSVHSVGYVSDVRDLPTTEGLAEVENFMASRMEAMCGKCSSKWFAESGSWHFNGEADEVDAPADFEFDDAVHEDPATEQYLPDGLIMCPAGCGGHVGFMAY